MPETPDFLDEIIAESTALNPEFPALMAQARRNREVLATLASERKRQRVSQTALAAQMGTSQSAVSALEKTASDALLSTVEKYADALGLCVEFHLVPKAEANQAVVLQVAA